MSVTVNAPSSSKTSEKLIKNLTSGRAYYRVEVEIRRAPVIDKVANRPDLSHHHKVDE